MIGDQAPYSFDESVDVLGVNGDNASHAARAAGIARSQLYRLMSRLGLR